MFRILSRFVSAKRAPLSFHTLQKISSVGRALSSDYRAVEASKMDGATLVAHSLKRMGVQYIFGVVGVPIIEVAFAAQAVGIKYIGMRNEQAASHAASVVGYLTSRPGVCLVVSGPGLLNALAGMGNAKENGWPLLVIGGSSDSNQDGMGAFQEFPQVDYSRPLCNYACRPDSIDRIPIFLEKKSSVKSMWYRIFDGNIPEQAIRMTTHGKPGVSYFDLPGDFVNASGSTSNLDCLPGPRPIPRCQALQEDARRSLQALYQAHRPLVIVGKGAAQSGAELEVRRFIDTCRIPFIPTPMGKGVISDDHELCVISARSRALKRADVILLVGARLNWILHFGLPPRYAKDVKIIQIDHNSQEFGNNKPSEVALHGDIKAVVKQLNEELLTSYHGSFAGNREWWAELQEKMNVNKQTLLEQANDNTLPMNFYRAYAELTKLLPRDAIIVNEGANTMDIGRTMIPNILPRHRLDAGTFGTMGVGTGFAIAAALIAQDPSSEYYGQRVFCIQGDSAFGFSGMEIETAVRYKLPIIFLVMNNNGIYSGVSQETWNQMASESSDLAISLLPTSLLPSARYEKLIEAFGCQGHYAFSPDQLYTAVRNALTETEKPSLIHVAINPTADRKPQEFQWLTKSSL